MVTMGQRGWLRNLGRGAWTCMLWVGQAGDPEPDIFQPHFTGAPGAACPAQPSWDTS